MENEDLNALHAEALAQETAAAAQAENPEVLKPGETSADLPHQVVTDPAAEIFAAMQIAVALLSPTLPYLPAIYTEPVLRNIAAATVKVSEKYGWNTSGFFEKYAPEIMLLAAVLPTVPALTKAHRAHFSTKKAAATAPAAADTGEQGQGAQGGDLVL